MLLDEVNKIGIAEAMKYADESYDELSDEELDEIFDENTSDVDLIQLEKEIQIKENYDIYIEDVNENYVFIV